MALIPSTDQVVSAAANAAQLLVSGGVADLRPMPRTLVYQGPRRRLHRYDPAPGGPEQGDPVLLVAPLAAPARAYDLRRGGSLVEHLVAQGRPTYLLEYGDVSLKDRTLRLEDWVDELLPATVRATSDHAGGRPVHLVGWSLGGVFALLVAADSPGLPIASVAALGSPVDLQDVPLLAPARPLLDLTRGQGLLARALQALTGTATLRWALELSPVQRLVTGPIAIGMQLDDTEFLAQVEAVGALQAGMTAYPGRSYGQLYHRFLRNNAFASGSIDLDGRTVSLADVEVPVLVVGGSTDGIAPIIAVRAALPHLRGAREVRLEIVPGGHLGLLTGRQAPDSTWAALDEWLTDWSGVAAPVRAPARKAAAKKAAVKKAAVKKAAVKKAAVKKAAVKKAATKKAPAKKTAARKPVAAKAPAKKAPATKAPAKKASATKAPATKTPAKKSGTATGIGTNPQRRYGSAGSRSLSR
ncbi:MAG: alpha/beta fold hydrolase [Nocardioides sp.]